MHPSAQDVYRTIIWTVGGFRFSVRLSFVGALTTAM
jgi:hypothetical protein